MLKSLTTVAILAVIAAGLIFPWIGLSQVFEVSEAREGVVVHEMRNSGELLLPYRHGSIVPSKPPLFHWIGYLAAHSKQNFSEFDLRLPSALAALGMVLLTYIIGCRLISVRTGFLAGLLLLTTYSFLRSSQNGRVDTVFSFFILAAVCRWFVAVVGRHRSADGPPPFQRASNFVFLQVGALTGLAALAKGPLGLVLPVLIISLAAFALWGFKGLISVFRTGWLAALVVAVPWYAAAYLRGNEQFVVRQLIFENVHRYLGAEGITAKPSWYYLAAFWTYAVPWSFVLIYFLWRRFRLGLNPATGALSDEETKRVARYRAGEQVGLFWLAGLILFFSLAVGKRKSYLLPALPALSLVLACWFDCYWGQISTKLKSTDFRRTRLAGYALWTLVVLVSAGSILTATVCCSHFSQEFGASRQMLASISETFSQHQITIGPWFSLFAISSVVFWYLGWARKSFLLLVIAFFAFAELNLVVVANFLTTAKSETHSYRRLAKQISGIATPADQLTFIKDPRDESYDGLFFYLNRRVELRDVSLPPVDAGLYLARASWFDAQDSAFKSSVSELLRGSRLRKPETTMVVLFRINPIPVPASPPPSVEQALEPPLQPQLQIQDLQSSGLPSATPSPEAPPPESHNSIVPQEELSEAPLPESTNHPQIQIEPLPQSPESSSDSSPTPGT